MAKVKDTTEEIIAEIIGPDAVPVVRQLKGKENVSEFTIANRIKEEINFVRNVLYRLYEKSLVSSQRKKDKKKGWYIYYWTFKPERLDEIARKAKEQKIERLKERLERERNSQFYMCENNCVRLDFDQAAGFEFRCPECNRLLEQQDNTRTIEHLESQISELESAIETKKATKKKKAPAKKAKKAAKKAKKAKKATKKKTKKVKKKATKKKRS